MQQSMNLSIDRLLKLYETHSVEEISDKIGFTEGAVKQRLRQHFQRACKPIPEAIAYKKRGKWPKMEKYEDTF